MEVSLDSLCLCNWFQVMVVCDISMTPDNALVKNTIESAFNRMIAFNRDNKSKLVKGINVESVVCYMSPELFHK